MLWFITTGLVHVVWQFLCMDVMTKVRYFLMLHFQFLGPWDAQGVKIQVNQGLWHVSRSCSTSLKSSNHKFESSKNIVLLSLCPWTKSRDNMNKSNVLRRVVMYKFLEVYFLMQLANVIKKIQLELFWPAHFLLWLKDVKFSFLCFSPGKINQKTN